MYRGGAVFEESWQMLETANVDPILQSIKLITLLIWPVQSALPPVINRVCKH